VRSRRRGWHAGGRGGRRWDASLQGSATYEDGVGTDGQPRRYHQRIHWLREVCSRPDWRFWGGLYALPYCPVEALEANCGPVRALLGETQRLRFHQFFDRMADARVALARMGQTRWTYRHNEAVYAGCEVVSGILLGVQTLPTLPTAQMAIVADHAPIAAPPRASGSSSSCTWAAGRAGGPSLMSACVRNWRGARWPERRQPTRIIRRPCASIDASRSAPRRRAAPSPLATSMACTAATRRCWRCWPTRPGTAACPRAC
jgi:hypothetical protein